MRKNIFPAFLVTGFLFFALPVLADVKINEIMYDLPGSDSDREWVEIFNNGSSAVTITSDFRFITNGTSHTLTSKDNPIDLPAGGYAVIVDDPAGFGSDWPGLNGIIVDSSFSLNNTAGDLQITTKDADGGTVVLTSETYSKDQGAVGDGHSLQFYDNAWVVAKPTPLAINTNEVLDNSSADDTSTSTDNSENDNSTTTENGTNNDTENTNTGNSGGGALSAHAGAVNLSDYNKPTSWKISAGRERLGSVGSPLSFSAISNGGNKGFDHPRFTWSFGDGTLGIGEEISHTYRYAGRYTVVLNAESGFEKAVSRIEIEIIDNDIKLEILDSVNKAVRLINLGKKEINLGQWNIVNKEQRVIIAKDTIIRPGQMLDMSLSLLGWQGPLGTEIKLLAPNGFVVTTVDFTSGKFFPKPKTEEIRMGTTTEEKPLTIEERKILEFKLRELRSALSGDRPANSEQKLEIIPPEFWEQVQTLPSDEVKEATVATSVGPVDLSPTIELPRKSGWLGWLGGLFGGAD